MSEFEAERLRQYIPKGDGYNSEFANDLEQAAGLIEQQAKEIEALRELLLKSSNHLANVDNMTAAKWGVVGINIINEITQTLEKSGNPTKLLKGE